ncbi:MAG: TonB-dependent receptor [Burkholderiaceae bacterium]
MKKPQRRALAIAMATIYSSIAVAADDPTASDAPAPLPVDTTRAAQARGGLPDPAPSAPVQKLDVIEVTGKKLDAARNGLSPETGSTIYRFDQKDIQALPFGEATPLNQLVLQSPGVVQDSYGQLHVRGDHSNLQYRINGVVIPEALSGFGQSLDTRFADQINILTGALPAQYGYRTAGIVDIRTRGAGFMNGGSVSVLGGSRGHGEGTIEYAGAADGWTWFGTGSFLRGNDGIENPTSSREPLHDTSKQQKAFGYLSRIIDADSRISFIVGNSDNKFQIPNVPGKTPSYAIDGDPTVDSARFDAKQNEKNAFQIATLQASPTDKVDYQLSAFHRYTDAAYQPDALGDLLYNGVASQVLRRNSAVGLQGDLSFRLNDRHTLRTGVYAQHERFNVDSASTVFAADDSGQTSTTPFTIVDNSKIAGVTYGVYLQDEWQPLTALTVNYGARFDHVSTVVNEKQFSPRFGLTYDLARDTRLHFGYSRYFTPPPTEKIDTTSVAKFLGTTNALPSDADTSVKSERSNYFDIGLSHQLTPEITVGIDGYYRKVKNLQDEGQFGNALIYSAFNYAQGRIRGIELSASYKKDNLNLYANAAVSKAEGKAVVSGQFNFDPDELAYIASHWVHLDHDQKLTGSAGASYQFGNTRLAADALYGSGLRNGFANTGHLPSYVQINLSATETLQSEWLGKLEGRVAVINLFDRSFELRDGSGIGVGAPQYGPRRGLYMGATKFF